MATAKKPGVRFAAAIITLTLAAALSACGGGGGGSTPTETPAIAGPVTPITPICTAVQIASVLNGETRCKNRPTDGTYEANAVWANWVAQPGYVSTNIKTYPAADRLIPSAGLDNQVHMGTNLDFVYSHVVHNGRPTVRAIFQADGGFFVKLLYADKREAPFGTNSLFNGSSYGFVVTKYWVMKDGFVFQTLKDGCGAVLYDESQKVEKSSAVACPV